MLTCEGLLSESLRFSPASALIETGSSAVNQEYMNGKIKSEAALSGGTNISISQQQQEVDVLFASVLKALTNGIMNERLQNILNSTMKLFEPLQDVIYLPSTHSNLKGTSDKNVAENKASDNFVSSGSSCICNNDRSEGYRDLLLLHTSVDPLVTMIFFDCSLLITYAFNHSLSASKTSTNAIMLPSQTSSTTVSGGSSIYVSLNVDSPESQRQSAVLAHDAANPVSRFDTLVSLKKHLILQSINAINRCVISTGSSIILRVRCYLLY